MIDVGVINNRTETQILLNRGIYLYPGINITPPDTQDTIYQINPRNMLVVDKNSNHRLQAGQK